MADEDLEPAKPGSPFRDPDPSSPTFGPPEEDAHETSAAQTVPSVASAAPAAQPSTLPPLQSSPPEVLPDASRHAVRFLNDPPPRDPVAVSVPAAPSIQAPQPEDLIEIDAKDLGRSEYLKDSGARVREAKIPEKQLKQEETAEQAWRRMLSGFSTTDFVHVRLYRRRYDGSYLSMGSRYNMGLDEVREIDKLIPYAGRWVIAVAHAANRADNDSAYRKFKYERGGPEMPEGWSFDGADLDQELDMATARELIEEMERRRGPSSQAQQQQQQATPPYPQGAPPPPWGGMPGYPSYPSYPSYHGYSGYPYSMPPYAMLDEERRRRREDEERRRRDEEARERREAEERRERERREEREKLEAERKAAEERHAREMEALRKIAEEARLSAEKIAKEWQDRFAQEQQRWRDERDRLEREKLEAAHRSELEGLNNVIESLKKEVSELRAGGTLSAKSSTDWTALANSIVPLLTGYLASEREARADERRARLEDAARERERISRDAEQMTKLVSMLSESQINSAKIAGDLIQRMQDPSALMNLTRLVSETLGGNVQLVAQLIKSGIAGGGGGHSGIDWGSIIGQGLETLGGIASSFADLKQEQLRLMGEQQLGSMVAAPQQALPMQQPPHGSNSQPQTPPQAPQQAPQQARTGTSLLRGMVDTIKEAVAHEHDPKEVAGMIDALVYAAKKYKVDQADPKSAAFVKAIQADPEKTLRAAFPKARPEYIHKIAMALLGEDDSDSEEPESQQKSTSGNGSEKPRTEPDEAMAASTAPQTSPPPVVALPGRRGRGRPRKDAAVATAAQPTPSPAPPVPTSTPPVPESPTTSQ